MVLCDGFDLQTYSDLYIKYIEFKCGQKNFVFEILNLSLYLNCYHITYTVFKTLENFF